MALAIVAIGRNEGSRLIRCIGSAMRDCRTVIYVDSGSTDGSIDAVRRLGATAVALDMSVPFTAARARNAGFAHVLANHKECQFVQFVDGDCDIEPGWLKTAQAYLEAHPEVVAVFGRRREQYPRKSIYNLLCDLEWRVDAGIVRYFGGDVMVRVPALQQAGGYRPDLIAGEEPELSVRLRALGWKIVCLDAPMTIHDAAMTRFRQWWKRSTRTGYAYAQGAYLHGGAPEFHWVRESIRSLLWGLAIPAATLGLAWLFGPEVFALLLVYPLQLVRMWLLRRGRTPVPGFVSLFLVLGKFSEAAGQMKFLCDLLLGRRSRILEYK